MDRVDRLVPIPSANPPNFRLHICGAHYAMASGSHVYAGSMTTTTLCILKRERYNVKKREDKGTRLREIHNKLTI
jgi:hypothetical protein